MRSLFHPTTPTFTTWAASGKVVHLLTFEVIEDWTVAKVFLIDDAVLKQVLINTISKGRSAPFSNTPGVLPYSKENDSAERNQTRPKIYFIRMSIGVLIPTGLQAVRLARCVQKRKTQDGFEGMRYPAEHLMPVIAGLAGNSDTVPNSFKGFAVTPVRIVLIIIGLLSLVLGIIGIFLPLLPTVPFVLLSAACFSRGSKRMHDWLVRLPFAGKAIDDYEKGRGVSRKSKATALFMMWAGMTISAIMLKLSPMVLAFLATIAVFATVIIVRLPKAREQQRESSG